MFMVVIYNYKENKFLIKVFVLNEHCYVKFSYGSLVKSYLCENVFLAIELAEIIIDFYAGDTEKIEKW